LSIYNVHAEIIDYRVDNDMDSQRAEKKI